MMTPDPSSLPVIVTGFTGAAGEMFTTLLMTAGLGFIVICALLASIVVTSGLRRH